MAQKRTRAEIDSYFNTGDKPTEAQYHDTFYSLVHKDDVGTPTRTELVVAGSGTYDVPADKLLLAIVLLSAAGGNAKVGTTNGGNEIHEQQLTASVAVPLLLMQYYAAQTTLYFTGTFTAKIIVI